MRQFIIMLALAGATIAAHAGSYSNATESVEICKTFGGDAVRAYRARQANQPQPQLDQDFLGTYGQPLMEYALDYGYNYALTEQGAFRQGTAKCLDNLDYLSREWKYYQKVHTMSELH
jgi:hypothetical protein